MLQTKTINNALVYSLKARKRLDFFIAEEVKTIIIKSIKQKHKSVIFDLTGIDFIDSASFTMLLELTNEINASGKYFYFANVSNEVKELILLLKLENTFKEYSVETVKPKLAA